MWKHCQIIIISSTIIILLAIILPLVQSLKGGHHRHVKHELNGALNYEIKWFEQKVDHFAYSNNDKFKQRYVISTEHWIPNGPIWFYAGNEGDIMVFANNTGFMWEYAKQFKAMVVFMEHRYYGESMPYGNRSMKDLPHLGYLTVEQALADFADFLAWIQTDMDGAKSSPVVVFGGSYGGMLASWFRMKYPHLTVGALAASAPIWQFPGIYDCEGYNRVATKDFTDYSPDCSESIRRSWKVIRKMAQTDEGLKTIGQTFSLCRTLTNQDLEKFIGWLTNIWGLLPMIDYPNPADFLAPLPAYPIKHVCQYLTKPNADDRTLLQAIANGVQVYTNYTGKTNCNDIHTEDNDRLGTKAWDFQSCTEMVLPICSDGVQDMFERSTWNFTEFSNNCRKEFGTCSDKYKALILFGGEKIKSSSNIIFSNGMRDPWSAGGVLETLSETLIAIKIPGACHHEDLRETGPNDPQVLLDARQQELKIIRKWMDDHYQRNNIIFKY